TCFLFSVNKKRIRDKNGYSVKLQPHSIVQRRLLEGNITRLRGEARDATARVRSPLADSKDGPTDTEERSESTADDSTEERESLEESERSLRSDEEDDNSEAGARHSAEKPESTDSSTRLTALIIQSKCCETEVKASINTGSLHNHISTSCCQRLGITECVCLLRLVPIKDSSPCGATSSVTGLQLQLGRQTIQCSAYVKGKDTCCLDLNSRVLKLQGCGDELPFLNTVTDGRCQHDTNENL
uniref:Aspartic peptidase DDI1-type domain-containing protein n=1 Tax=Poecilia mexicana TaxID=48701 RepID=A0A3B3XDM0_9TELE